jgi:hypothetical protein
MKRCSIQKAAKGKKGKKASRVERQVRGRALKHARKLALELRQIHDDISLAAPPDADHWLWVVDLKRAYYAMDQVIGILEGEGGKSMSEKPILEDADLPDAAVANP